jgi:hypothetical protein
MKLAEGETSIACYPVAAPRRGAQATLTSRRLVWLQDDQEEHYPLDKISCVTYGFQRAGGRVAWAVILLLAALALGAGLIWAQGNLPALAQSMVATLADGENPERIAAARRAYQQRVDALMLMILPLWGLAGALAMYAAWLLYTGIRGETRAQITLFAVQRSLQRRGRDPLLLEFGEQAARVAAGLKPDNAASPVAESPDLLDWVPSRLVGR